MVVDWFSVSELNFGVSVVDATTGTSGEDISAMTTSGEAESGDDVLAFSSAGVGDGASGRSELRCRWKMSFLERAVI